MAAHQLRAEKIGRLLDKQARGRIGTRRIPPDHFHHARCDRIVETATSEQFARLAARDLLGPRNQSILWQEDVTDADRSGDVPAPVMTLWDNRDRAASS